MPLKVSDCDIELADDRTLEESASAVGCHFIKMLTLTQEVLPAHSPWRTVIISVFRGTAMQQ